jgi:succinylarginine dihydrolase
MRYTEINFDGLVGPTHNYAGLSIGNVASVSHKGDASNPRAAALQGLEKAWALASRGYAQAILPPHERPAISALRSWGISGKTDADVLATAARQSPALLAAATSASAMWTANACTMTPSADAADERAHFTPANLSSKLHRSLEPAFTKAVLEAVFADEERFAVHDPLAGGDGMADEGAANHTRFCPPGSTEGLHLFVFGRSALDPSIQKPHRFPARQTRESFEAIARIHGLAPERQLHLQQSTEAIDAGVFHNDVISVGNGDAFLYHEKAFQAGEQAIGELQEAYQALGTGDLQLVPVPEAAVSLTDAIGSYLFNSQLLPLEAGGHLLVAPGECLENSHVKGFLQACLEDSGNPIQEVLHFDLRESMRNGGGPACLRQRVVLSANEQRHIRGRVLLDETLYGDLRAWIEKHYRESLTPAELADPRLLEESRTALDELTRLLHLPAIYPFQR